MATSTAMAKSWAQMDPNPITKKYVEDLILTTESVDNNHDDDDHEDRDGLLLQQLFPPSNSRISFGTAGLRSAMKPGPLGMNDLTVIQTAQGIAKYCQNLHNSETTNTQKQQPLIAVVGYDHRENAQFGLSSRSFALFTAFVFLQAGMECILLDGYNFTPLVPFTMQQLGAAVGIMITASHNPKADNGYKVYAKDACQIRSPMDAAIADEILQNLEPWTDYGTKLEELRQQCGDKNNVDPCLGMSHPDITEQMTTAYFDALVSPTNGLKTGQGKLMSGANTSLSPSFVYTAMHGVGYKFAKRVFETFELPPFQSVLEQQNPDATFPTVPFPNPEEKGALDLAKAYAVQQNCCIVLANDPDADRLAVAEMDAVTKEWTIFHGDQIGAMLGLWLWEQIGKDKKTDKKVAMCASTASSKLLKQIADVEGFHFEDTMTGFKWIGSRLAELNATEEYASLFGYEEAIGFCCGNALFDKDGISAMAVFAELSCHVYQHKKMTLKDHMQAIYDKYGEFVTNNGYFFMHDSSVVNPIMNRIRNGGKYDIDVGPYEIESVRDLGEPGYDSLTPDNKPTLPTSNSSPMMTLRFTNGCIAQFRASGTEPKFKYYIEMKGKPGVARADVAKELTEMAPVILEKLLEPEKNGLKNP
eukprot:CAMPEP_0119546788 /NCGR_PEP_ID=MMETSP1352-20130426/1048_1 /TAXON_ID=265584 /ORGANISM="Stauroneis constricta, Strain CCMP1120" /LENGTH=642 /DNA_ID=CAMNT_0007591515 /DNA_START=81 /DNA_END=2009 /DNA_ORIENTATION=+